MLNSYLVNAAVANGTGTSQVTVSAFAFAGSNSLYSSLCTAFRTGTAVSQSGTNLIRSVSLAAILKQVGSTILVNRYVSSLFTITVGEVSKVVRDVGYSAATVANSALDFGRFLKTTFTLSVFTGAGKNVLDSNQVNGYEMNGFALNDGIANYKEERAILGVIAQAVAGAAASTIKYVWVYYMAIANSAENLFKKVIPTAYTTTVDNLLGIIRQVGLTETVAVSEAVSYIKFLRVVIATLIVGSQAQVIKMAQLPITAVAESSEYVIRLIKVSWTAACSLVAIPETKDVSKTFVTNAGNLLSAVKQRVVERLVTTVVSVTYTKHLWNYAVVLTAVKVSRIRLAFLVGVRKIGRYVMSIFGYSPTTVVVNTFTIIVADTYNDIVVPPEDTEIV